MIDPKDEPTEELEFTTPDGKKITFIVPKVSDPARPKPVKEIRFQPSTGKETVIKIPTDTRVSRPLQVTGAPKNEGEDPVVLEFPSTPADDPNSSPIKTETGEVVPELPKSEDKEPEFLQVTFKPKKGKMEVYELPELRDYRNRPKKSVKSYTPDNEKIKFLTREDPDPKEPLIVEQIILPTSPKKSTTLKLPERPKYDWKNPSPLTLQLPPSKGDSKPSVLQFPGVPSENQETPLQLPEGTLKFEKPGSPDQKPEDQPFRLTFKPTGKKPRTYLIPANTVPQKQKPKRPATPEEEESPDATEYESQDDIEEPIVLPSPDGDVTLYPKKNPDPAKTNPVVEEIEFEMEPGKKTRVKLPKAPKGKKPLELIPIPERKEKPVRRMEFPIPKEAPSKMETEKGTVLFDLPKSDEPSKNVRLTFIPKDKKKEPKEFQLPDLIDPESLPIVSIPLTNPSDDKQVTLLVERQPDHRMPSKVKSILFSPQPNKTSKFDVPEEPKDGKRRPVKVICSPPGEYNRPVILEFTPTMIVEDMPVIKGLDGSQVTFNIPRDKKKAPESTQLEYKPKNKPAEKYETPELTDPKNGPMETVTVKDKTDKGVMFNTRRNPDPSRPNVVEEIVLEPNTPNEKRIKVPTNPKSKPKKPFRILATPKESRNPVPLEFPKVPEEKPEFVSETGDKVEFLPKDPEDPNPNLLLKVTLKGQNPQTYDPLTVEDPHDEPTEELTFPPVTFVVPKTWDPTKPRPIHSIIFEKPNGKRKVVNLPEEARVPRPMQLVGTPKDRPNPVVLEFKSLPARNPQNAPIETEQGDVLPEFPKAQDPSEPKRKGDKPTDFKITFEPKTGDPFYVDVPSLKDARNRPKRPIKATSRDSEEVTFITREEDPKLPLVVEEILLPISKKRPTALRLPQRPRPDWRNPAPLTIEFTPTGEEPSNLEFPGIPSKNPEDTAIELPEGTLTLEAPGPDSPQDSPTMIRFIPKGKKKTLTYIIPSRSIRPVSRRPGTQPDDPSRYNPAKPPIKHETTFMTLADQTVTFVSTKEPEENAPYKVTQILFEPEPGTRIPAKLPEEPEERPLRLIFTSPDTGKLLTFEIPVPFTGDENPKTTTAEGGTVQYQVLDPSDKEPNESVQLLFSRKKGKKPVIYELPGMRLESTENNSQLVEPSRPKGKPPPKLDVSFQTADNRLVTFRTNPDQESPTKRLLVVELVFETDDGNEIRLPLPSPNKEVSPDSLKLIYREPGGKELTYIFQGLPLKGKPKSVSFTTQNGKLSLDFPDPDDDSRDGIIFYLTPKSSQTKYKYEVPGMNLEGFDSVPQPENPSRKPTKMDITYQTIDKKEVSILTDGEPPSKDLPYTVLQLTFKFVGGRTVIMKFPAKTPTRSLELVYTKGDLSTSYEFPGVPETEPSEGAKRVTFKSADRKVTFDIPSSTNEFRTGVILILKEAGGEETPFELSGFRLQGTPIRATARQTYLSFQTLDEKEVTLLTASNPQISPVHRIMNAIFEVGSKNVSIKLAKVPKTTGGADPQWLQLRYTSMDGEVMYFEIPGLASDGKGGKRKLTFSSAQGSVVLSIPGARSRKSSDGIEFVLNEESEKMKYMLPGWVQLLDDEEETLPGENGPQAGRSFSKGGSSAKLLFFHPGWKLQYEDAKAQAALDEDEDIIFYGLGNCPYKGTSPDDLETLTTPEELITFYMNVMRTECLSEKKKYVRSLLDEGYIVQHHKHLIVPPTLKYLNKAKLNSKEAQKLSSAFELSVMTKTYVDEAKERKKRPKSPDSSTISRSTHFLTELSMNYITESNSSSPLHFIRLTRNLIGTLKTGFTKLTQDQPELEACSSCAQEKKTNYNDRIQLLMLIQFIMHGLEPLETGKLELDPAFKGFYTKNKAAIETRVNSY